MFRLSSKFFVPDIVLCSFKTYIFCDFYFSADISHLFFLLTPLYTLKCTYKNCYKVLLIPAFGFS